MGIRIPDETMTLLARDWTEGDLLSIIFHNVQGRGLHGSKRKYPATDDLVVLWEPLRIRRPADTGNDDVDFEVRKAKIQDLSDAFAESAAAQSGTVAALPVLTELARLALYLRYIEPKQLPPDRVPRKIATGESDAPSEDKENVRSEEGREGFTGGERSVIDDENRRRRRVKPKETRKSQQARLAVAVLTDLQLPEFRDALKNARFSEEQCQVAIEVLKSKSQSNRSRSVGKPSEKTATARLPSISDLNLQKRRLIRELAEGEIFGRAEPTVAAFQAYLDQLSGRSSFSFQEKQQICSMVNYAKRLLKVDLLSCDRPCVLGAKGSGGSSGGFQLKLAGKTRETLYAKSSFPPLRVRVR